MAELYLLARAAGAGRVRITLVSPEPVHPAAFALYDAASRIRTHQERSGLRV